MKLDESRELDSARKLLSEFESEISLPTAKGKLSEALSLLEEIAENDGAESQVARNLAAVYGAKTAASANTIPEGTVQASPNELYHWEGLLREFGRCGFELPPIDAALSKLNQRLASRYVAQLTDAEKQALLKQLEAQLGKEHT